MQQVVLLTKEEYDVLFRQASSNTETIRTQAIQGCDSLIRRLREMRNPVDPNLIADFMQNRRDTFIAEALKLPIDKTMP